MQLADLILAIPDTQYEVVLCPEWVIDGKPVELVVRSLTGAEKDDYEASCLRVVKKLKKGKVSREATPDFSNARAKLVALAVCKSVGDNTRVFTDSQVEQLGKKNGAVLDRLYSVASRLSAVSDDDISELVGNG